MSYHTSPLPPEDRCDRGTLHCEGPCEYLHTCPYRVEINDDNESLCNCCGECEGECAQDV